MADISGTTALGTVTSYAAGAGEAAPMEVNQVKGKAKGKGKLFRKARAKVSQVTKEREKVTVQRAMETVPKVHKKVQLLAKSMQTHVHTVGRLGMGQGLLQKES